MTPGWAAQLSGGASPEAVARVVRLSASVWVTPDRLRTAIAGLLNRPAMTATDVIGVIESMASPQRPLADASATEAAAVSLLNAGAVVHIAATHGYPRRLHDAWPELGAPLWLFAVAPDGALPSGRAVAIVGTRHPTLDGTRTARELAVLLARNDVTVISGMARGIDQAAHLGALDAGGKTVGVLGTGFGVDYPRRDGPIRDAIAAAGGLVSELVPGTPPRKPAFLWRNRIIAGLADATVVVEGRTGSGALHTARMAGAQGREVLAVPGPVRAPTSRAPLDLIRDGAQPLTRLEDVLDAIGVGAVTGAERAAEPTVELGAPAQQVLPLLGAVPASPAALAAATKQPVPAVLAAVAELTSRGLAAATPRGIVRDRH